MTDYRHAANTMKLSWKETHQDYWEQELDNNHISRENWYQNMFQLLREVNDAAASELNREHLSFASIGNSVYNADRVHGTDVDIIQPSSRS